MRKFAQRSCLVFALQLCLATQWLITAQNQTNQPPAKTKTSKTAASRIFDQTVFDDFVMRQMANERTPGLTVGFMKGEMVWVKGYGYADLENKVPAKAESAYRLASVTKSMTAVAILQLVEQGKIDLDAEVQTYVPYFPKKQWPVTVRQLLGHLGGISHYKNEEQEAHIKTRKSTREAIAIFENFDLVAEPGTRYSYSSYGYNLLGAVIEGASGMSYGEYMRKNVWQPAGMNDTRMDDPLEVIPNRVRGYQLIDGKIRNSEFIDISSRFAAGGTRSTVPDLLKYAKGLMDGKLLSSASWEQMTTSMSTKAGRLTDYGMGWETTPFGGRYLLIHSGGQQETRTLLYIMPARKMAFAAAVNFEAGNPGSYLERLFQLVTGSPTSLDPYSADKVKSGYLEAIKATFNYGAAYFEHMQKPLSANDAELAEAFAYFNNNVNHEALGTNRNEVMKKVREGVHPVAKQALTTVGSYMALKLSQKKRDLQSYANRGALAFFQDYNDLVATDQTIPKELRFNEGFSAAVTEMARDWSKSDTEYVRQLWLMSDDDLNVVGRELRKSFAGASVYPNVLDDFFNVTRQYAVKGNHERARKTAQLAVELYPDSGTANFLNGVALVLSGDSTGGGAALRKSLAIDPNGQVRPSGLNNIAYLLAGVGLVDDAIAILKAGIDLYPKEANLYDSLGEFQLRKGDKAKALESYKKALEINPSFQNAENAKEIVKKLSAELGK
jgi:CubicO group peptidase (beta-lactamase class C family)